MILASSYEFLCLNRNVIRVVGCLPSTMLFTIFMSLCRFKGYGKNLGDSALNGGI